MNGTLKKRFHLIHVSRTTCINNTLSEYCNWFVLKELTLQKETTIISCIGIGVDIKHYPLSFFRIF